MPAKAASWWAKENKTMIRCHLCPHECDILKGRIGFCGVRKNSKMELQSLNYGKICVATVDSIEKKPIFHYKPGSKLYSIGTIGCNFDCEGCQNSELARGGGGRRMPFTEMSPETLVSEALSKKVNGIGWTFNEPIVWAEFVIDTSVAARKKGLFSMMNTNGFIGKKARDDLLPNIDVMKIDIKSFSEAFYRENCKGTLRPVLETCVSAKEQGIHVELAYLMIPELNDSDAEIRQFSLWVAEVMGTEVPVHLFRFSPAYRLAHLNKEPLYRMKKAREIAMASGLAYVYFGGFISDSAEGQNTCCPCCGEVLISRKCDIPTEKICVKGAQISRFCPNFSNVTVNMRGSSCPRCGAPIQIKLA